MGVSSKSAGETPDLMLYPQPPSFNAFMHCPPKNTNSLPIVACNPMHLQVPKYKNLRKKTNTC